MNTFLPYPDFAKCAKVLDNKRIGKQIIECQQIFKAITDPNYGWQNHPAVNMWRGCPSALYEYAWFMASEWIRRRHKPHRAFDDLHDYAMMLGLAKDWSWDRNPEWLGDERLHSSHRSNLLRKDPEWYGQFGWTESPDMPYFWPTKELA